MQEAAQLDPKNADLHYNIGVINMQQGNVLEARKAFEQALKIKPSYADAALNISTTYINEGNGLIEKMNALGNSAADVKKFNELRDQKDDLFKKGAEILENLENLDNALEIEGKKVLHVLNRFLTLRNTDIKIVDRVGHYVFTLSLYDLYGKPYDYELMKDLELRFKKRR